MMSPEIMLFGTKIILPESGRGMAGGEYSGESCVESSNGSGGVVDCDRCLEGDDDDDDDDGREKVRVEEKHELAADEDQEEELCHDVEDRNPIATDESHNDDDDTSKTENEQSGSSSAVDGQPKSTLKKPDKILPCPRCKSTDTKFCYFNNYNVNQPRHFCKGCQRYWTDGGTMRNVPVGAGRRKTKNYYARHGRVVVDPSDMLKPSVLSFGEDIQNGPAARNPNGFLSPFTSYPAIYPMPFFYAQPAVWNCSNVVPWANQSPLGKHSRDGEILVTTEGEAAKRRVLESSVVVPKTLRIGDPDEEAARSSIWSTLGIESRGGLLKALQPKGGEKKSTVNASSPLMLANPAALSRSISFQEGI